MNINHIVSVLKEIRDKISGTGGSTGNITLNLEGIDTIKGSNGLSAYEIWLGLGNTGTQQNFIDSLKGQNITISAYQIAVANGFVGTEQDWLISLKGQEVTALNYNILNVGTTGIDLLGQVQTNESQNTVVVECGCTLSGSLISYILIYINGVHTKTVECTPSSLTQFNFEVSAGSTYKINYTTGSYGVLNYLMEFEI